MKISVKGRKMFVELDLDSELGYTGGTQKKLEEGKTLTPETRRVSVETTGGLIAVPGLKGRYRLGLNLSRCENKMAEPKEAKGEVVFGS